MVWLILAKYSYLGFYLLERIVSATPYTRGNWLRITCGMQSTPSVLEVVKKKKNYEH